MRRAFLSRGQERRSIAEALTPDSPYVQLSSYAMQIERYLTHFDRSQLLVLLAEDLRSNRRKTLERVLEFLGLGVAWAPPNLTVEYHQSADKRAPRNWAAK